MSNKDEDYMPRRVRPYQLLFDAGIWHLYGFAEERKALRFFTLSRIKDPVLTTTKFTLPADFDYCSRADGSNFGVFAGEKKHRFSVAFYDEAQLWVRERKWATDQVIKETADHTVITFTSTQYNQVLEKENQYYDESPGISITLFGKGENFVHELRQDIYRIKNNCSRKDDEIAVMTINNNVWKKTVITNKRDMDTIFIPRPQ
jgi:hypothetical protein